MNGTRDKTAAPARGLAVWLLERLWRRHRAQPRLALVERIALGPRQSLALIEAEGRRLLVATSQEGAPAFYSLDGQDGKARTLRPTAAGSAAGRVSW
jgi:flagellar biogenesis protein FliO